MASLMLRLAQALRCHDNSKGVDSPRDATARHGLCTSLRLMHVSCGDVGIKILGRQDSRSYMNIAFRTASQMYLA